MAHSYAQLEYLSYETFCNAFWLRMASIELRIGSHIPRHPSLPADVLWGSFVTHSFLPHGRRPGCA